MNNLIYWSWATLRINPTRVDKQDGLDLRLEWGELSGEGVEGFGGVSGFDRELLGAVEGGGEVQEFGGGFGVAAVVVGVQDSDLIPIELKMSGERVCFCWSG